MRAAVALSSLAVLLCGACGPATTAPQGPPRPVEEPAPAPAPAETPLAPTAAEAASPTPIADAYRDPARRIIDAALADEGAWQKLQHLTDRIGPRLSGSKALDRAIAWAAGALENDGHENVRLQKVMVPRWVRGAEEAELTAPVSRPLHILTLGGSVGTPRRGLEAEVVVATSFDELTELGDGVKGKIVLFNVPMPPFDPTRLEDPAGYGATVPYRTMGAIRAAQQGAVGVLVRSVTAHSLRSPHTGAMRYDDKVPKIPAVAVTVEDAELIARLARSGETVKVKLQLGARTLPDVESANVIGELVGREKPGEVVLIGAHIDSWDVGQGAHDDGAGVAIVMQALTLLRKLDLVPRRTIRVVLFTNEENGLRGAARYAEEHREELKDHVAAMESDSGGFKAVGFQVQVTDKDSPALGRVKDIVSLLEPIGATSATPGFAGADIMPLAPAGVPLLGYHVEESRYFDIHHTHADTLDKVDPRELREGVAAMAVMSYVLADMPERLAGPPARSE